MSIALIWFRRDLRLHDNPALTQAVADGHELLPLYIESPEEAAAWPPGAASQWWLHHSLSALQAQLQRYDVPLYFIRHPHSLAALQQAIADTGAQAVYWNRRYEPTLRECDQTIKKTLKQQGVTVHSDNASVLNEPWTVKTQQNAPFKVFTPYWRACQKLPPPAAPLAIPRGLRAPQPAPTLTQAVALSQLQLLPKTDWTQGLQAYWSVGEAAGLAQLTQCCDVRLQHYHECRDIPASEGSSRLSPYLHFGEVSPRQVYHAVQTCMAHDPTAGQGGDSLLRQLYWREFARHLLYFFPQTATAPLYEKFQHFPWANANEYEPLLQAWQAGRTGFPLVDAGMRQLWHTGWMHNRVRMITASWLTKNARVPWQMGARWFWDTLVDADLANNTLGWQWVAGCGADAAPYYRIFNPYTQSEKCDPQGDYLRCWLPELAALSLPARHKPPPSSLQSLAYPAPVLDYKSTREAALAAYAQMKQHDKDYKDG